MNITKTLYVADRNDWRKWLTKHAKTEKEIWLIYYRKNSGKPRISYNDSVEEALCFGWIDSIVKTIDHERFAQRFSPRNPKSNLSEMNKERIRRLISQKKMTKDGLSAVAHAFDHAHDVFEIPQDMLQELQADKQTWENFQQFPESYKRIRIGWSEKSSPRVQKAPHIFSQKDSRE